MFETVHSFLFAIDTFCSPFAILHKPTMSADSIQEEQIKINLFSKNTPFLIRSGLSRCTVFSLQFIFEAAARHCVDIATHRHGCCVLQRCIAHSTGQHQAKLLAEVSRNGLMLAQDAYG